MNKEENNMILDNVKNVLNCLNENFPTHKFYYEFNSEDDVYIILIDSKELYYNVIFEKMIAKISNSLWNNDIFNIIFSLDRTPIINDDILLQEESNVNQNLSLNLFGLDDSLFTNDSVYSYNFSGSIAS